MYVVYIYIHHIQCVCVYIRMYIYNII
jgi:hypothetical protein